MPAILKRQQFKDSGNDKTGLKELKRQNFDKHNNKEENSFDKNKSKIKNARYIFPLFILLFSLS